MPDYQPIPRLENPLWTLLQRLQAPATGTNRYLIALAGLPGSGKTTLAAKLVAQVNAHLGENTALALSMDGFHYPQATLRQFPDPQAAFARRGAPWTFDVQALASRLRLLRDSAVTADVAWPDFQHELRDPVEGVHVVRAQTRLVLVEDLYLLMHEDGWQDVSSTFDERWYLDVPEEVALGRLCQRHMSAWGISEQAAQERINANDRLNAQIVASTRSLADYRVTP